MRVHITNLNGYNHSSAVSMAQQNTLQIAQAMGFSEMGLYHFDVKWDNDEQLSRRLDGIIAPLWYGDIVVLQLPTWCDLRYENRLISKIRMYRDTKIVMFIHDIIPLMFNSGEEILRSTVDVYNQADVIVLPSKAMHETLLGYGLKVKKVIYQELWDYPMSTVITNHPFEKRLFFTGDVNRFPFLKSWKKDTCIEVFGGVELDTSNLNIHYHGYKENLQLISQMSEGGFGLVWAEDSQYDYYKLNQPYKIAAFFAAGIPVIVREGLNVAGFVEKNKVGYVVNSLDEADRIVQQLSKEQYDELLNNVRKVQYLVTNGFFTRKLLNDAVILAMTD